MSDFPGLHGEWHAAAQTLCTSNPLESVGLLADMDSPGKWPVNHSMYVCEGV